VKKTILVFLSLFLAISLFGIVSYDLQKVIIVPEEPSTEGWRKHVMGDLEAEKLLLQMAHERRESYEKRGSYF